MSETKRGLDINKLKGRLITPISSEEALKDVIPIDWSEDVINGSKKVIVRGLRRELPVLDDASLNCEWDIIGNIFSDAIKRKGLSKDEVADIAEKIRSEYKYKPIVIVGDYELKKEGRKVKVKELDGMSKYFKD